MNIIYTAMVGSKAHGTDDENSDTDVRHVFLRDLKDQIAPLDHMKPTKEIKGEHKDDEIAYELSHFGRMLLKNNPTAHEIAWSKHREGDVKFIIDLAYAALDSELYISHNLGFITSMLKDNNPKSMYHAARISLHLKTYMTEGAMIFDTNFYGVGERQWLLDLKHGETTLPEGWSFNVDDYKMSAWTMHKAQPHRVQSLVYGRYLKEGIPL